MIGLKQLPQSPKTLVYPYYTGIRGSGVTSIVLLLDFMQRKGQTSLERNATMGAG